jgi:hypothetical protein
MVIPSSAKWSYHLPQGGHTIFRKVVIPSSAKWSYHLPQGGHTIFRKVIIPFSAKWLHHHAQDGRTTLRNILDGRRAWNTGICLLAALFLSEDPKSMINVVNLRNECPLSERASRIRQ